MTDIAHTIPAPLAGKTALVMGLANKYGIAWPIGQAFHAAGARVAFTHLNERVERDVNKLTAELPGTTSYGCNVDNDAELDALAARVTTDLEKVDILVHAIAYAPADEMKNRFLETTREGFRIAHNTSVYSLIAAARHFVPLMPEGGSIITLSYLGADRAFPRYNVMGVAKAALESTVRYLALDLGEQKIRVNAISAGPVRSFSARGIPGFDEMMDVAADRAPIKGRLDPAQVGSTAVFLASDGAAAITGETVFVDGGYHAVGM